MTAINMCSNFGGFRYSSPVTAVGKVPNESVHMFYKVIFIEHLHSHWLRLTYLTGIWLWVVQVVQLHMTFDNMSHQ